MSTDQRIMSRILRTAVAVAVLGMALPTAASAQRSAPEPAGVRRPYRGLFGGSSNPAAPQSLVLSLSTYGAYDDNVLAGLGGGQSRNSWFQQSGTYWGSQAGIDYSLAKPGERVSFGVHSSAQLQYRAAGDANLAPYYFGGLSMDWRMTRSMTLNASQTVSYAPNYSAVVMPVVGADLVADTAFMPNPDLDLFVLQTVRTGSSVSLSQRFGRNMALVGSYSFRTANVNEDDLSAAPTSRFRDYRAHTGAVRASYSRPFTPNATMVLGYGVRRSSRDDAIAEPRVMHNVNAGVDYSRALSFSRRTSFSFGTGSAITVSENLQLPDARPRTRARLIGNASLVHEMGRTWTARLSYVRGLISRYGFGELFFTDAVGGTIEGLVSRRLSISGTGTWSTSTLDRPGANGHGRAAATAQASYALATYLGLYARYVYYRYDYGDDIPLDPRLPRGLERQGIRVGLTTSVPLIR